MTKKVGTTDKKYKRRKKYAIKKLIWLKIERRFDLPPYLPDLTLLPVFRAIKGFYAKRASFVQTNEKKT